MHWLVALLCLLSVSCRTARGEEHLQRELSFLVPYVNVDEEERAVRRVLMQRKLVVEDTVKRAGLVALVASTFDRRKTAVRVITPRGVVLAEDGDTHDYFGYASVSLFAVNEHRGDQMLLGIVKRERGHSAGCAQLYRVLPDGRPHPVAARLEQFGSFACLHDLRPRDASTFTATVAWPALSPFTAPALDVDLEIEPARLDRPNDPSLALRVIADGDWRERAAKQLEPSPRGDVPFSVRHARAVALAALALSAGQNVEAQLGAYRSELGTVLPGSPEAEIMASTSAHIADGWLDSTAIPETAESPEVSIEGAEEALDEDAIIVEPEP